MEAATYETESAQRVRTERPSKMCQGCFDLSTHSTKLHTCQVCGTHPMQYRAKHKTSASAVPHPNARTTHFENTPALHKHNKTVIRREHKPQQHPFPHTSFMSLLNCPLPRRRRRNPPANYKTKTKTKTTEQQQWCLEPLLEYGTR